MSPRSLATAALAVLSALALATAACGGGGSSPPAGGGPPTTPTAAGALATATPEQTVALLMRDISYDRERLQIAAGQVVEIQLQNGGALEHDFTIERLPGAVSAVGLGRPDRFDVHVSLRGGQDARLRLRVDEPGEYVFYCTVPGHRSAGMEGILVVE